MNKFMKIWGILAAILIFSCLGYCVFNLVAQQWDPATKFSLILTILIMIPFSYFIIINKD